jgi:hypothetical protein
VKSEVSDTATGTSEDTESVIEQATEQPTDYAIELLRLASQDGIPVGEVPEPKDETQTTEVEAPATEPEAEPETEEETDEPEEKPAAEKKDDVWPESAKARVAEEAAKRRRANERADKAEALAAQYQAQLAKVAAPQPTEDNPFGDIQDATALERLERSYEKTIDLADENPDGAVDVVVGKKSDGTEIRRDFTPEELVVMRKKADKAIRKFIPERRDYLHQRAVADAQALEVYPELKDPNSEFTKVAAVLADGILSGRSAKDPNLLVWIGHAAKGYLDSMKRNGHTETRVKDPAAQKIVESARQKVAPTPTRTRQFVERGTSSAKSVEKAAQKLEQIGDKDSAEEYVGAVFSRRGASNRVEPIAE